MSLSHKPLDFKHCITTEQRTAASTFWAQVLKGDREIPNAGQSLDSKLHKELVESLTHKNPLWNQQFMSEVDSQIFDHRHDLSFSLTAGKTPQGALLEAAVHCKIPVELFPKDVSMTFAESNQLVVNGVTYPAEKIIHEKISSMQDTTDESQTIQTDNPAKNFSLIKAAGEEIGTAATAHYFKTAPERLAHVIPENKRTTAQKIGAMATDSYIDYYARQGITGNRSLPETLVLCSTGAIAKAIILKNRDPKTQLSKEAASSNDLKSIGKASAQGLMTRVLQTKATEMAATMLQQPVTLAAAGMSYVATPIITSMIIAPMIQNLRLPEVPQTLEKDKTTTQEIAHMATNAGISVAVGLGATGLMTATPALFAAGVLGAGTGVVVNSLVGKADSSQALVKRI